jgi:hypothetical protein
MVWLGTVLASQTPPTSASEKLAGSVEEADGVVMSAVSEHRWREQVIPESAGLISDYSVSDDALLVVVVVEKSLRI